MKFTKKQIERQSRQIILKKIGTIGQKKLLKSSVLIVGAGGLGSPIAIYLAALGIGKIGIIDNDIVEISNLNRQVIFSYADIKKKKSLLVICFALYAFGWTPQTNLRGDVSSFPGYRLPYKTMKILYHKIDNN